MSPCTDLLCGLHACPDYDTATSMVKPLERNTRYVDATLTVPKNVLYSMSNLNVAFDRELSGPAMFTGLNWCVGDGTFSVERLPSHVKTDKHRDPPDLSPLRTTAGTRTHLSMTCGRAGVQRW